jgi:hypothetical protein
MDDIRARLRDLRVTLEPVFAPDTAVPDTEPTVPSAGHCAAVAAIVWRLFGGEMCSTRIDGESHWFNRVSAGADTVDVDLTGDQLGRPAVQIVPAGTLYEPTKIRPYADLLPETRARASVLADRAGLVDVADFLSRP